MIELGSTYLIVKDFNKSISFYENLLETKVSSQNKTRWAEFNVSGTCIALFNPDYDQKQYDIGIDINQKYSDNYLKEYKNNKLNK